MFRTTEQQYSFNFPHQCGTGAPIPDEQGNYPDVNEHIIQEKDIIVVASDGVFDNLFDSDLMECITGFGYFDFKTLQSDLVESANCIGYQSH